MATHIEKGRLGEEVAVNLLKSKGYIIHERNWRYGAKEVDIIAQSGREMIFVEVKLRTSDNYGTALQAITESKKKNLIIAANHYIRSKGLDFSVRYDIITIDKAPDKNFKIEHIERAFYPTLSSCRTTNTQLKNRRFKYPK